MNMDPKTFVSELQGELKVLDFLFTYNMLISCFEVVYDIVMTKSQLYLFSSFFQKTYLNFSVARWLEASEVTGSIPRKLTIPTDLYKALLVRPI